eukprot:CAMPEP_0117620304 /NCGR_PEP_ID=MMETSP0784-20121206/87060_1 /TAXON_ID=39447 /ORGANISM="" /LENGTH=71 /DNA_ID=CAMNT_0005424215 /DNA_START=784 /DNA_END=996 /DNA_ORIENTATION=-
MNSSSWSTDVKEKTSQGASASNDVRSECTISMQQFRMEAKLSPQSTSQDAAPDMAWPNTVLNTSSRLEPLV